MSSTNPIYVRICRKNQSFFVMCSASQSALYLKRQVAQALQECGSSGHYNNDQTTVRAEDMRLLTAKDGTVLENEDLLTNIQSDDELHILFPIADDEWEPVEIGSTDRVE